ncbi:MAG: short-chain dehydrogenase/reductase SDR [Candidatus Doudnabacteria bacterium Gr01-1014_77]|uniref:Short-chain dehydrogenase/reductase SDR n=1 Tax=Candidatus Doudnabacteria bacterium Gr01-1014_77 TaxID=2017133 RepID=A0A554J9U9_9BACT|nr:MAG: short-chain dehydrogenase/reductase SDR [Candidatus Doudnabacteria bacterium Gr01-1014_77]
MVDIPTSAEIKETQPLKGKLVVITGTSRGIGSKLPLPFAEAGADIVGTHVSPGDRSERRQQGVINQVREVNPEANFESVLVDITDSGQQWELLTIAVGGDVYNPTRKVDVLVLNAAGGLEEGKGEDWADRINHEAQIELVQLFLPHMQKGGQIIFMQSLWSHYYGQTKQYAIYEPVARTKHAAEAALRSGIPEFEKRGVKLSVLVGDVIRDTSVHSMFSRVFKADLIELESTVPGGKFPDADEVATVVRDMVLNPGENGATRYIGRDTLPPFDESVFGEELAREEVAEMLPMYNDNSLFLDAFELTGMNSGIGTYTTREKDFDGHFDGEFADMKVMPGHFITEMAAQAAGMVVARTRILGSGMPLFTGVHADFLSMSFPGETLKTVARFERAVSGKIICNAKVYGQDGTQVANFDRISFQVLPTQELGRRFYKMTRATRGLAPNEESSKDTSE